MLKLELSGSQEHLPELDPPPPHLPSGQAVYCKPLWKLLLRVQLIGVREDHLELSGARDYAASKHCGVQVVKSIACH